MSISFVLITFLIQMSVGMVFAVMLLPSPMVDKRFFKSIFFWSTLFIATALFLDHRSTFQIPEIFGRMSPETSSLLTSRILFFLFGFICFVFWVGLKFFPMEITQKKLLVASSTGLVGIYLQSSLFHPHLPPAWIHHLLLPFNYFSTSFILGGFLSGMIFGHYYLVNTEMPKRLLVNMAWILIGVLALRIIAVVLTLLLYKNFIFPETNFLAHLTSFQGHGIFFWQRILVGLGIPSVVVAMIFSTARMGSNQSATGIMYVAIAFVFIGELVARYLFLLSAIPL